MFFFLFDIEFGANFSVLVTHSTSTNGAPTVCCAVFWVQGCISQQETMNVCEAESQLLHEEVRVQVTYSSPSTPSCTHVGNMKWFSPEDYFSAVLLWGKGSAFLNNLQKHQMELYFIQQSRTVDCGFLFNFCICRLSLSRYICN